MMKILNIVPTFVDTPYLNILAYIKLKRKFSIHLNFLKVNKTIVSTLNGIRNSSIIHFLITHDTFIFKITASYVLHKYFSIK